MLTLLHISDSKKTHLENISCINLINCSNIKNAFSLYNDKNPNIILLETNSSIEQLSFVEKIRQKDLNTKIIIISDDRNINFLLKASELKLTKYLVKPVLDEELIEAIDIAKKELFSYEVVSKNVIHLKDEYRWEKCKSELYKNLEIVKLTRKEKKLIEVFLANRNSLITYDNLMSEAWDLFENVNINSVKTAIKKLRKKLPQDSIINVYGVGYKFFI